MWQALAGDAANAVLSTATQLYMAKKQREEEEKKRKAELLALGEENLVRAGQAHATTSQEAIQQMLQGFTGALL